MCVCVWIAKATGKYKWNGPKSVTKRSRAFAMSRPSIVAAAANGARRPCGPCRGQRPSGWHAGRHLRTPARRSTRRALVLSLSPASENDANIMRHQHALGTRHCFADARMLDGRTQYHPLRAAVKHPSTGRAMRGTPRMLVPHGALEMASACPRSNFSALCSRPTREPCVVAGISIAYGSYSVHTGRRTAHGAGLGARGGRIVKMNVPVHVPLILSR